MIRLLALPLVLFTFLIAVPVDAMTLRAGDILVLTFDGVILRIDPETGSRSVVASGGLLSQFTSGITVTPWGEISVIQSGNTVVRVVPFTGEQMIVAQGGLITFAADLTADRRGNLFLPSHVDACPDAPRFMELIRVDRITGLQSYVRGCPVAHPGALFSEPDEIDFAPNGVEVFLVDFALNGSFGGIAAINTITGVDRAVAFCGGEHIWPTEFAVASDGTIALDCFNGIKNVREILIYSSAGFGVIGLPLGAPFTFDEQRRLIATGPDPNGGSAIYRLDLRTGQQTFLASVPANLTDMIVVPPICPCAGSRNHGAYVSCVAHEVNGYLVEGFITRGEKSALVSSAAQSACGKPERSQGKPKAE
jgi:hypothetical protein